MTPPIRGARMLAVLACATMIAGCATVQPGGTQAASSPDDPLEPLNRGMYEVHKVVDGHFFKPIAQFYVDYTPAPIRQVLGNMLGNVDDLFTAINGLLQNKQDEAGHSLGRVIINSLFGIGGMIDVASSGDIPKYNLDFGQTFGVWGIPQGPYLFIPVFGPTTVRDGSGTLVRLYLGPTGYIPDVATRNVIYGVGAVELRAEALGTESLIDQAAIDPYTFIRRAYLQRREYLVTGGKRPKEEE